MTPAEALAHHRLKSARDVLSEADLLAGGSHYRGALNRLYYGALYAARALLALNEIDSSRHSGVIALFHQHFVRPGIVDAEVTRVFARAFEKRLTTDYGDYVAVTADDVHGLRGDIIKFVTICEETVARLTGTRGDERSDT